MDFDDDSGARATLRHLYVRVMSMIERGVLKSSDDAKKLQYASVDLRNGNGPTEVERFQQYGFTARPKAEATEVLVVHLGGNPDHPIIIAVDDRQYRLQGLAEGEVAIYDDQGQTVHFKRDAIWCESPTKVVAKAPRINLGDDDGVHRVMTEAGLSSVVYAKV